MLNAQTAIQKDTAQDDQLELAMSRHDVRASLAITAGFNQALELSFSQLCETYEQLVQSSAAQSTAGAELELQVEKLQADCHFCLSRMRRSLEQLGHQLERDIPTGDHSQCPESLDIQ